MAILSADRTAGGLVCWGLHWNWHLIWWTFLNPQDLSICPSNTWWFVTCWANPSYEVPGGMKWPQVNRFQA